MLCIPITGPSRVDAIEQIKRANPIADLIEFRVDLIDSIEGLHAYAQKPILVSHGKVDFDAEYIDVGEDEIKETNAKIIRSFHDFSQIPNDLSAIYSRLTGGDYIKIATMANSSLDAMKMLKFVSENTNTIGLCMGDLGTPTRILSPVVGNPVTFAALEEGLESAQGQLTVRELREIYNYDSLNRETRIYALIGDPVSHSVSNVIHNREFKQRGVNAVFVKIQLKAQELPEFLALAKELPFDGFAVTMPLKEEILKYVDHFERDSEAIGAINTLALRADGIHGCNTDGIGALDAIEQCGSVHGKKLIVLGAGGAAKAIAFEAKRRGAELVILNRTKGRAEELAQKLDCESGALSDFPEFTYDILVDATSAAMNGENPVKPKDLLPNKVMMDVANTDQDTPFLAEGRKTGCQIVSGREMFHRQAEYQFSFWPL